MFDTLEQAVEEGMEILDKSSREEIHRFILGLLEGDFTNGDLRKILDKAGSQLVFRRNHRRVFEMIRDCSVGKKG